MDEHTSQEQVIADYVRMLMEDTGMDVLPQEEKEVWEKQLTGAMQKTVTVALINALSQDHRKRFDEHLSHKEVGNALKVLVEGNPDYIDTMKRVLSQYNKSFLEKYEEELKKQS